MAALHFNLRHFLVDERGDRLTILTFFNIKALQFEDWLTKKFDVLACERS